MRVYESQYYHTTHFSLPAPKLPSALLFPGNLPAYKLPSLWGITAYSSFSQPFSGFYYNEKRPSCQECFSGFHKFMNHHSKEYQVCPGSAPMHKFLIEIPEDKSA